MPPPSQTYSPLSPDILARAFEAGKAVSAIVNRFRAKVPAKIFAVQVPRLAVDLRRFVWINIFIIAS
jgi:hypothetical protein